LAVVSILLGLYLNTFHSTNNVSKEQIEIDGGQALFHNGRIIEFFLGGDPSGVPLVFFHGAGSTGLTGTWVADVAKKLPLPSNFNKLPGMGWILANPRKRIFRRST